MGRCGKKWKILTESNSFGDMEHNEINMIDC